MRRRTAIVILALVAAALALGLVGVGVGGQGLGAAAPQAPAAAPSPATPTYEYLAALTDGIGPRVAGTSGERRAAGQIEAWFRDLGYTPETQAFTFTRDGRQRTSRNIVAVKPGESSEQIVIGAHYDSVAVGRGCFDNGTGVALMMALADALRYETTPYTLVFVAFGAEEVGLKGSKAFVAGMDEAARQRTVLMINFDSVATGDRVYCYSSADAAWPQLTVRRLARQMGATILTNPGLNHDYPYGTTGDWSDHVAFRKAGIPYLYFEATNWLLGDRDGYINTVKDGEIWHTAKDTLSYIEQRYPGRMQRQLEQQREALTAFLTAFTIPE